MQTTTNTSSLKVSFLNGIQEQRSLIRQLQVRRVCFWLALVGRDNKSPKKKKKKKNQKNFKKKFKKTKAGKKGVFLVEKGRRKKKTPKKKKKKNLQKTLTINFQCLKNNHPKRKRKKERKKGAF